MSKNIFEMSKDGKSEYCIDVIKVGTLIPIEGSDFLAQTYIGDASIVVRKDQVKEGDLLFYASNECQLNEKFLSANNLFGIDCYEKNSNADEVREYLNKAGEFDDKANDLMKRKAQGLDANSDAQIDEYLSERDKYKTLAKNKCGFFSHNGRVRMIRLKSTPSMGYLFSLDEMAKYCPKVKGVKMEDYLNVDFDTVDGELFVKAYVPPITGRKSEKKDKAGKRNKKLKKFDRIIPGEFSYHYDTDQLGKNMWKIKPDMVVSVTNKLHGTSFIGGVVKVKKPLKIAFYKRWFNKFVDKFECLSKYRITDFVIEYGDVYSSRGVIKNQFINKDVGSGYYKFDIWKEAFDVLRPYIPDGMLVYGEICGFADQSPIQKKYDYGCKPGEFFIMPYRITTDNPSGGKFEWNVTEVKEWTENLIKNHPELAEKVHPITMFYHGTLKDLYPEISVSEHWNDNVLHAMMNDKEHFGMEELEPMCLNRVPREGVVVRIDNDPMAEAFKLKCLKFKEREAKDIDKGNVDMEMEMAYDNTVI